MLLAPTLFHLTSPPTDPTPSPSRQADNGDVTCTFRQILLLLVAVLCITSAALAQTRSSGWGQPTLPYDGRFTFVRLRWTSGTYGAPVAGQGFNFWSHEFPRAEQNLMAVLGDVTLVDTRTNGSLILTLDDPNLFKHPIVMMWEPGFWTMTDHEAARLREYILKGGFVIFNDFERGQWDNFAAQMSRVIPNADWMSMEQSHPIFNSFFRIDEIDTPHPINHHLFGYKPEYLGLFKDNNPEKRLMAIVNYNTNLAEYWQMSGTGFFPIESENIGFRLGINYILYGITH